MGVAVRPGSTLASWTTAAACLDGSVLVWTTQSDAAEPGLRRLQGHKAGVNAVAFTPGGTTVLSASDDGTVKVRKRLRAADTEVTRDDGTNEFRRTLASCRCRCGT